MLSALKVIGLIVVVVVLVVGLALFWFIRQVRKFIKAEMDTPDAPPCRVNLEPEAAPQWRSADTIKQYADEFRALSFEEVGAFSIPEMGGLQLFGFVHPTERLVGVIYDHKLIEPTFDICCDFENGAGLSATNSSIGNTLDKRPDHPILWVGKNSVREVLEAVQNHPRPAARKPITGDEFAGHFKRSYAESMNWRLKKGGVSREEIRRQAERDGNTLDDEQLEEVFQEMRAANLRALQEGCVAQYLDETQPAAADWEPIRQRVCAIPETMESKEVIEAIASVTELDEEQRHLLSKVELTFGETAVDFMEKVLAQDIGALGLEKLGEVKEPVRASILLALAAEPFETQPKAAAA